MIHAAAAAILVLLPASARAQDGRSGDAPKDTPSPRIAGPVPASTLRWSEPGWAVGLPSGATYRSADLTNAVVFRGSASGVVPGTTLSYALLAWNKVEGQPSIRTLVEGKQGLEQDGSFALPELRVPPEQETVLTVILNEPSGAVSGVRWWLSTLPETPVPADEPKGGPVIVLKQVDPPFAVGQQVVLVGEGKPRSVTVEGVVSNPGTLRSLVWRRRSAPPGTVAQEDRGWMEMAAEESVSWSADGTFRVGPLAFGPGEHRLLLVAEDQAGGRSVQPLDIRYAEPSGALNPPKEGAVDSGNPPAPGPREGVGSAAVLKLGASISPESTDENRPLVFVFARVSQPAPRGGLRLKLHPVGGTAELDRDYRIEASEITLAEGETEGLFRLEVIDDAETEGEETVEWEVRPGSPEFAQLAPARVALRLGDNEGPGEVRLIWSAFIANEAAGTAQVRLARTGNHQLPGAVSYRITGDPELVAFLGASAEGRVTFGVGDSQATVPVPLPQDDRVQPLRQLKIQLIQPEGGMSLGAFATARLDVRDDDSPPSAEQQSARHQHLRGSRGLAVDFATERGFRYVIEYAETPASNDWKELTVLYGNNGTQSAWDSAEQGGTRFYRYRIENELLTLPTD